MLACAIPLTYSVLAFRASVFAGATIPQLSNVFIILAGLTILYLVITMYFMRLVDVKLRKEGTLQLF
jgi:uncharacterized phage infection (PIP) family protein YhgE